MIKTKRIVNPWTNKLQKILNTEDIAEKVHTHSINEINGLETILSYLNQNEPINFSGGYFTND